MNNPTLLLWIGQISERVTRLERRMNRLAKQVADLWTWGRRCALIAGIWIGAIWINATADEKAALVSALITALGG